MSKKLYQLPKKKPINLQAKKPVFDIKKDIPNGKTQYFRILGMEVTNNNGTGEINFVFEQPETEKNVKTLIKLPYPKNIIMGEPSLIYVPKAKRKNGF